MGALLKDRLRGDLKTAMKNKQRHKLEALKLALADCRNKEIELKADLSEAQVVAVLQKHVKQYEESLALYQREGRAEVQQALEEKLGLVRSYLPVLLSDERLKQLIDKAILDTGASSVKDMGRVIKSVQSAAKGLVDNRKLAQMVQERLRAI